MDGGILEPSLYTVKAVAILDNDGNRLVTKYYDEQFPTSKEQKAFEKNLFSKTHKANSEIIMFEGLTCVYRSNVDLFFYVVGSSQENELILASVLNALYDAVSQILRKNVEKRALLDNMDAVFLAVDEICDGGIILDSDATSIVQKVSIRTDDLNIGEQTMAQVAAEEYMSVWQVSSDNDLNFMVQRLIKFLDKVLQSAKEQIKWSLLK